jgi:hypothetical protein
VFCHSQCSHNRRAFHPASDEELLAAACYRAHVVPTRPSSAHAAHRCQNHTLRFFSMPQCRARMSQVPFQPAELERALHCLGLLARRAEVLAYHAAHHHTQPDAHSLHSCWQLAQPAGASQMGDAPVHTLALTCDIAASLCKQQASTPLPVHPSALATQLVSPTCPGPPSPVWPSSDVTRVAREGALTHIGIGHLRPAPLMPLRMPDVSAARVRSESATFLAAVIGATSRRPLKPTPCAVLRTIRLRRQLMSRRVAVAQPAAGACSKLAIPRVVRCVATKYSTDLPSVLAHWRRKTTDPEWVTQVSVELAGAAVGQPPTASGASIHLLAQGGESLVFRIDIPASGARGPLTCVAKCFFKERSRTTELEFAKLLGRRCCTASHTRRTAVAVTDLPVDVRVQLIAEYRRAIRDLPSCERPLLSVAPLSGPVLRRHSPLATRMMQQVRQTIYLRQPLLYHFYAGSLADVVRGNSLYAQHRKLLLGEPVSSQRCCLLVLQCLEALAAHHQAGVLHGDIKPGNILFEPAQQNDAANDAAAHSLPYVLVLSDYGQSVRLVDGATAASGRRGTPTWRAPEVFLHRRFSAASDVYAMGSTLVDVVSGRRPHAASGLQQHSIERSLTPERVVTLHLLPILPPQLAHMLESMICDEPAQRCSLLVALRTAKALCS